MKEYKVIRSFVDCDDNYHTKNGTYQLDYDSVDTDEQNFINCLEKIGFIKEIPEQSKTVWDLKDGEKLWYITGDGTINSTYYSDSPMVAGICNQGNGFLTREDAEKELARRKARETLIRDTKGFKPAVHDGDQYKWHVYWLIDEQRLEVDVEPNAIEDRIYFATVEDAEASIKSHEKEWLCYLNIEEGVNGNH